MDFFGTLHSTLLQGTRGFHRVTALHNSRCITCSIHLHGMHYENQVNIFLQAGEAIILLIHKGWIPRVKIKLHIIKGVINFHTEVFNFVLSGSVLFPKIVWTFHVTCKILHYSLLHHNLSNFATLIAKRAYSFRSEGCGLKCHLCQCWCQCDKFISYTLFHIKKNYTVVIGLCYCYHAPLFHLLCFAIGLIMQHFNTKLFYSTHV